MSIVKNTTTHSRINFVLLHPKITKEVIPELFQSIIQLKKDTKEFENSYVKTEYIKIFDDSIPLIKKQFLLNLLDNHLGKKGTSSFSKI